MVGQRLNRRGVDDALPVPERRRDRVLGADRLARRRVRRHEHRLGLVDARDGPPLEAVELERPRPRRRPRRPRRRGRVVRRVRREARHVAAPLVLLDGIGHAHRGPRLRRRPLGVILAPRPLARRAALVGGLRRRRLVEGAEELVNVGHSPDARPMLARAQPDCLPLPSFVSHVRSQKSNSMQSNAMRVRSGTSIDTVGGGTMKRQSTRTYAASLHKVDQRYERRKRPACTARLRTFRYLDRLLTPPSCRVTARRRLREHSRASAKP